MSRRVRAPNLTLEAHKLTFIDEPKSFEGLPAHVQVMGKPMQDEELMEILKVVERILAE